MVMSDFVRTVLVVEDEALVRSLLVQTLETAGFEAVGAANAVEAVRILKSFDPDVALLDLDLGPGANGMDLLHIIKQQNAGTATLFLTKFPDVRSAGIGEKTGATAQGFLRKELVGDSDYLIKAIEAVLANRKDVRHDRRPDRPLAGLTSNQISILRLLAQGYTNSEIAKRRGKTVSSVEQLLNSTFRALGLEGNKELNSRIEAVRIFIQHAGVPNRDEDIDQPVG
jgi:DNA-binding NarL/FixJ family response regulator